MSRDRAYGDCIGRQFVWGKASGFREAAKRWVGKEKRWIEGEKIGFAGDKKGMKPREKMTPDGGFWG